MNGNAPLQTARTRGELDLRAVSSTASIDGTDVAAAVCAAVSLLHSSGEVFEIRALGARGAIAVGYYDDVALAAAVVAKLDRRADVHGIYVTANALQPACLARAANHYAARVKASTDGDVLQRRWLPIDLDPARPAGISSTDAELTASIERAAFIRDTLAARRWPAPAEALSGNGRHLLYAIDLPNDAASKQLIEKVLAALDLEFGDDAVTVDRAVGNASRIIRAYGTMARKGDNIPDRPHRRSVLVHVPTMIVPVSREQLEALAGSLPTPQRAGTTRASSFDLRDFLARHGIAVVREGPWDGGGTKYILRACPFDASHAGSSAALLQFANGAIAFRCLHNSCVGREWRDVRSLFEPHGAPQRIAAVPAVAFAEAANPMQRRHAPRFIRAGDLLAETDEANDLRFVVDGLLVGGGTAILAGRPKGGKSTFAANLALAVERGDTFLGRSTRKGAVLYLALEGARGGWRSVLRRLGVEDDDDLWMCVERAPDGALQWLRDAITERSPVLVIIDPLQRLLRVRDSNDYGESSNIFDAVIELARASGASMLFVHHSGKTHYQEVVDEVMGSTAWAAGVDTVLVLRRRESYRTIVSNQRFGEDLEETVLDFDRETLRIGASGSKADSDLRDMKAQIIDAVAQVIREHPGDHPDTETIAGRVEGRRSLKLDALKAAVATGDLVVQAGSGKKGDPYRYGFDSAVPDHTQEPQHRIKNDAEKPCGIDTYSVPDGPARVESGGNRVRRAGNRIETSSEDGPTEHEAAEGAFEPAAPAADLFRYAASVRFADGTPFLAEEP